MGTIKGIKEELKLLNGILRKLQNGENINVHVIERCLNNIQEPNDTPAVRGLPEPKIPQNLLDEREKKIGEIYIKLAEIDSEEIKPKYSKELLDLFKGHKELINKLIGKSNDEVVAAIKKWNEEKDKSGQPKIKNYKDNLRSKFARELKKAGIITISENRFIHKL